MPDRPAPPDLAREPTRNLGAPAGDPAVALAAVVKRFGSTTAVDHLDLDIPRGVCFGLLGPNGAGKSTLMALLTGAAVADEGSVHVLGLPMPTRARGVRARAGLVPQLDNLDGEITCRDNLEVYARLYGIPRAGRRQAVEDGLALAQLTAKADAFVDQLSGGMRRRLLIARGLLHSPELVLLDEPTVGLDPQIRQELWQTIGAVRETGATVVLTTHYIEEAERLCDTVAIVHHGRLLALGTPADLISTHVGSDVVVEVHGDGPLRDRIAKAADDVGIQHRPAGTSVALFGGSVEDLGPPVEAGDLDRWARRPANLEDVFVTLTGATL